MTNFTLFIALFVVFNNSSGFEDIYCINKDILMLPAPENVYQKETHREVFSNVTIPPSVLSPAVEFYSNVTVPSVFVTVAPEVIIDDIFEEDEDDIHVKSMKIAGFIAQCMVFIFVYSIITIDTEQFDENENGEIVVYKLHRAREVQTCPLPARQNIRIMRRPVVSEESDC